MSDQIDTLLSEQRRFPPPAGFAERAQATGALYQAAARDLEGFWAEQARALDWIRPWDRVLEWTPPHAKWFVGGKLNVSANCLDRHLGGPRRNKAAIVWEGEPGDRMVLTYWELAREVNRCANALRRLGIARGDRVAIYLPMIPQAAVAMLACARIGAVHSVVFGGFSAESLGTGSTTPRPWPSSPRTAAIAGARCFPSSASRTRPSRSVPRSAT